MSSILLFIGIAAATGLTGIGSAAKGLDDKTKAKKIIEISNEKVAAARDELEIQRNNVSEALNELGVEKVNILEKDMKRFLNTFEKLKNVDFKDSLGLNEVKNLHIDQKDFEELESLTNVAIDLAKGLTGGAALGTATAFGAYSAAGMYATASTGTAISTLSGIAAKNATLAFFGGGSIASGGLGMAGGTMVLGGLVAGPALMVTGLYTSVKAQEELDRALSNKAEADKTTAELKLLSLQCGAIRRRSYMFYMMLSRLDTRFHELIEKMETIVDQEGIDYSAFNRESKKTIAMCASNALSIKSILDTPILNGDGDLTEESQKIIDQINQYLKS